MTEIEILNNKITIPSKWEELTPHQVKGVAWVLFKYENYFEIRYFLLHVLLGVKPYKPFQWFNKWYRLLNKCDYGAIAETLIRGMKDEHYYNELSDMGKENYETALKKEVANNPVAFLFNECMIYKNPCPKLKNLHGPKDLLINITIGEFIYLEKKLAVIYTDNKVNMQELDELCAILWRAKAKDYDVNDYTKNIDIREKFTDVTIPIRAKFFKSVSAYKKYAILLFITGCMNKFKDLYPLLFVTSKKKSSSTSIGARFGWNGVLLQLSGKEFGDYNQTLYTRAHIIFQQLHILREKEIQNPTPQTTK